jgi:hypothetical protein
MKTVREIKIETSKIKDVEIIEKTLKNELDSDKPRKGVVDFLKSRIELLTIKPSSTDVSNIEVEEAEEVEAQAEPLLFEKNKNTVVLHKVKDIIFILNPYETKLVDLKTTDLKWKDTADKIGYQKIKDALKGLVTLRKTVEAERKTFNAPYSEVVSFSNENCGKLIGEIKDFEGKLSTRKIAYDTAISKEKEAKAQKVAAALAEKQKQAEDKLKEELINKKAEVSSADFQSKYGAIISRAKQSADVKKPAGLIPSKPISSFSANHSSSLFDEEEIEKPKPLILSDEGILDKKLGLLSDVLSIDSPDTEKYINLCKIIDTNVAKIIAHIKANL